MALVTVRTQDIQPPQQQQIGSSNMTQQFAPQPGALPPQQAQWAGQPQQPNPGYNPDGTPAAPWAGQPQAPQQAPQQPWPQAPQQVPQQQAYPQAPQQAPQQQAYPQAPQTPWPQAPAEHVAAAPTLPDGPPAPAPAPAPEETPAAPKKGRGRPKGSSAAASTTPAPGYATDAEAPSVSHTLLTKLQQVTREFEDHGWKLSYTLTLSE